MPGLLRAVVGTAVISGTAQATRNAVDRRQAEKNMRAYSNAATNVAQDQAQSAPPPQQQVVYAAPPPQEYAPPPPPPEPAPVAATGMAANLQQLAQLHEQGILSDEEFAEAKQKVLAGG